ncbi:MAG TPA: PTS sugar transporter subunit IIC [Gemmatimonadaceae bacterium]|nr:PTS sugar transporter subunit IIC [Gemmatimonadaceae bacterium]
MTFAAELLPLALLGALLGLDVVSFPQAMVSRPLVSATLAGALVGQPGQGLIAGAVLELFALDTLPFGASRYPEWGTAGVVGGALFALQHDDSAAALPAAVCAALLVAWGAGWTMVALRRLIGRWAHGMRDALAQGSASAVTALQLRGLTADFVRGGAVTWLSLAVFLPLERALLSGATAGAAPSRVFLLALAGATAGSAIWRVIHTTKGARWFLAGGLAAGGGLVLAQ